MADAIVPPETRAWLERRTYREMPSCEEVSRAKAARGLSVSVVLPALNEEATIGPICAGIRRFLVEGCGLVDELVVIDSGSADGTAAVAAEAGARVVAAGAVLRDRTEPARHPGKGEALWKSLAVAKGDIVVWLDSDLRSFEPAFVTNLVAPLIADSSLKLCKGFYRRPIATASGELVAGGARVTELAARPLLNLFFPELAGIVQPLGGEYAGLRDALWSLPFFTGYGVEAGLLIDVAAKFGIDAVAQADLGTRVHRNRDLLALGRTASEVVQAILRRAEDQGRLKLPEALSDVLVQFDHGSGALRAVAASVPLEERPPMREILGS